jgi:hypothetical protein
VNRNHVNRRGNNDHEDLHANTPAMSQEKAMRPSLNQTITYLVRSRARRVTIHIIRVAVTMSRAADNVSPTAVTRCVGDLTFSITATN